MGSGIYKITCVPTGDFYIGSTSNFSRRWASHKSDVRRYAKKGRFLELCYKYTVDDFLFEILESVHVSNLISTEQKYIDMLKPTLNLSKCAYNPSLDPKLPNIGPAGELHADALLDNDAYACIFLWYYKNPDKKALDCLSIFEGSTPKMLQSIYGLGKHKWLQEAYPYEYGEMLLRKTSRTDGKFKTRYIVSPEGKLYSFDNMTKFCKLHNLSQSKVSEVCNLKRKQHKGWTSSEDVI